MNELPLSQITYSNTRLEAHFDDWPYGSKQRCQCLFEVTRREGKGERCSKQTTNPGTNVWNKPKHCTYAHRVRIMDGSNGQTYVVSYYIIGHIFSILQSDLKYSREHISADDSRFGDMLILFGLDN